VLFVFACVQKDLPCKDLFQHSTNSSWSLHYLITFRYIHALPKSVSRDQSFLLSYAWVFSLVMRIYRPQYIDRVWRESPSSCNSFLDYKSWMLPDWTTECHLTPDNLKKFQSSLAVWGHRSGRWRCSLFVGGWKGMYVELSPSSGKHYWYAGWAGHCILQTKGVNV